MKKLILSISFVGLLFMFGCGDYGVLNSKPGQPIDPVTNLKYSISGNKVSLSWKLPSSLPEDIAVPVSIYIKPRVNDQDRDVITLDSAATGYTYTPYDSTQAYSFTVKVKGDVVNPDSNAATVRYSLGKTVFINE